jgi:hypothetical protein
MPPSVKKSPMGEICERLGEMIEIPKAFGLIEDLPPRVLAALTRTREILMEQMNGDIRTPPVGNDGDLCAELSQDADTNRLFRENGPRSFNAMLCDRMEQLHLSTYDVAVSLGTTIQYVSDLRGAVKVPTEQRLAKLALVLGVTQENLRTAIKEQTSSIAATV